MTIKIPRKRERHKEKEREQKKKGRDREKKTETKRKKELDTCKARVAQLFKINLPNAHISIKSFIRIQLKFYCDKQYNKILITEHAIVISIYVCLQINKAPCAYYRFGSPALW